LAAFESAADPLRDRIFLVHVSVRAAEDAGAASLASYHDQVPCLAKKTI
jgi:hypothetical protein